MNSFVFLLYISIFNNYYWMRLSTIWRIIKPEVIKANWGLDNSSCCAKTEFNNCFIIYFTNSKQTEIICILFVLRKKQFLSPSAAVVVVISMASVSQYDSCRHSNMAQTHPNFFHTDFWRHFANMNVKNPYLVSHWVDMTISVGC
jgi:hypothetical protein